MPLEIVEDTCTLAKHEQNRFNVPENGGVAACRITMNYHPNKPRTQADRANQEPFHAHPGHPKHDVYSNQTSLTRYPSDPKPSMAHTQPE